MTEREMISRARAQWGGPPLVEGPAAAVVDAARKINDPMVADGGGDRWWEAHAELADALDALDETADRG